MTCRKMKELKMFLNTSHKSSKTRQIEKTLSKTRNDFIRWVWPESHLTPIIKSTAAVNPIQTRCTFIVTCKSPIWTWLLHIVLQRTQYFASIKDKYRCSFIQNIILNWNCLALTCRTCMAPFVLEYRSAHKGRRATAWVPPPQTKKIRPCDLNWVSESRHL
jgi:hypothetical protein